jgi:hypothetical protein
MLLTVRFPMVDHRTYADEHYANDVHLPRSWSAEDGEFVRHFGAVADRRRGPVADWPLERAYCHYKNALKFDEQSLRHLRKLCLGTLRVTKISRRLYTATERNDLFHVDLQLAMSPRRARRTHSDPHVTADLTELVHHILATPVLVLQPATGRFESAELYKAGDELAKAFETATSQASMAGLVRSGDPAICVEARREDRLDAPWSANLTTDDGTMLTSTKLHKSGRHFYTWVIRSSNNEMRNSRALRTHLLRLHAERNLLRQLCWLLGEAQFLSHASAGQLDTVQSALDSSMRLVTKLRAHGYNTSDLLGTAFLADQTLTGMQYEALLTRIAAFRPNLARRVGALRMQEDQASERLRKQIESDRTLNNYVRIQIEEAHMAHYDQRGSQIGAAGDNAIASNFTFGGQLSMAGMSASDRESLEAGIETLRAHVAGLLTGGAPAEIDGAQITPVMAGSAIGALTEAQQAVADGDEGGAVAALKKSGTWLASFAEKVGVTVVAAAIRSTLGLP